jgi:hypothetical protein
MPGLPADSARSSMLQSDETDSIWQPAPPPQVSGPLLSPYQQQAGSAYPLYRNGPTPPRPRTIFDQAIPNDRFADAAFTRGSPRQQQPPLFAPRFSSGSDSSPAAALRAAQHVATQGAAFAEPAPFPLDALPGDAETVALQRDAVRSQNVLEPMPAPPALRSLSGECVLAPCVLRRALTDELSLTCCLCPASRVCAVQPETVVGAQCGR